MQTHYIAIDLGASSGRVMLAHVQEVPQEANPSIDLEEIHRFPNPIQERDGHSYWDFDGLYEQILEGLTRVAQRHLPIVSIGIDTWGVDFVLYDAQGKMLSQPFSYRDNQTADAPEAFFTRIPRAELYQRTGIQILNINSVFQMDAIRRKQPDLWAQVASVLFMPDAFVYRLTGARVAEYTMASTSGMMNPFTRAWDDAILREIQLSPSVFGRPVVPGQCVGTLLPQVQQRTGLGPIPVIAVAEHDTASAVASIPVAERQHSAFLSSGTWSLMGMLLDKPVVTQETYERNFTNEGGVGAVCFLKNICGMWLLERCKAEWAAQGRTYSYAQLTQMAAEEHRRGTPVGILDPDDPCFANPPSMGKAIQTYCQTHHQAVPESDAAYCRCIFTSLAHSYGQTIRGLQALVPTPITSLHILGGGSQNDFLNQLTQQAIGMPVVKGYVEATAIGNIRVQIQAQKR